MENKPKKSRLTRDPMDRLHCDFEFLSIAATDSIPDVWWWPNGPIICVVFRNTAECVDSLPKLWVCDLCTIALTQGVFHTTRTKKETLLNALRAHICSQCSPLSLSMCFCALACSRRLRKLPVCHVCVIDDDDVRSGVVVDDNVISVNVLCLFTFILVYDGNAPGHANVLVVDFPLHMLVRLDLPLAALQQIAVCHHLPGGSGLKM